VTRYRIRPGLLRAPLEQDEVLLNPDTGVYHLANVTGRSVLAALGAGDSVDDVIRQLVEETGQPRERVLADVNAFVQAMVARGVLQEVME
jgi:hypothetical protein